MKFINKTGNTILVEDINLSIPYYEDQKEQHIYLDLVKKSMCFRNLILYKNIEITSEENTVFGKNLIRLNNMLDLKNKKEETFSKESSDIEVKITGHFFEAGGYAKVNRNLALGLNNLGVKVKINPVNSNANNISEKEIKELSKVRNNISKNAICIDSIIPSFSEFSSGRYKILYTTLESCTIPKQFLDTLSNYNEIWVTSDFCKEVMEKHGIKQRIEVVQNSINIENYTNCKDKYVFNPSLKKYVFGSLFGWSYRKGYDALLRSYLQEFNGNDDVSLLIVSRFQNRSDRNDIIKSTISDFIKKYGGKNPPHIARCSKVISEEELPKIYRAMNCFCLPTRGEGFLLPAAEASLCDVPVICTNYSGQTMFLKKDNSYLVDIDNLIKMEDGKMQVHYWDGQMFPDLTSDDFTDRLRKTMRHVFNNKEEAFNKNTLLKRYISENYNINSISKRVYNRLCEIKGKL